jgi:acyl carrier protein
MTRDQATALLRAALLKIAPDVDLAAVDSLGPLQEMTGIDSRDFLTLVTAIQDSAEIEIPASDYPKLATLSSFVSYLMTAGSR